jgi:sulfatase-like protein
VKFVAAPGETKIDFYGLTPRANLRIYMDRLFWTPADDSIKVQFGKEWTRYAHGAGGSGRSFNEGHGGITVRNSGRKPLSMTIGFEGRLYPSVKKIQENYVAEVQYVDRHVGILWNKLREFGLLENTIVVLTADHGESLGEHSRIGHLFPLWGQIIDVPLIIYYPRLGFKGKKVEQIVDHLDIAPTILDLLRRKVPPSMEGESLKRYVSWAPLDMLLAKREHRPRALAYTFAPQGRANMYSVIEGPMKLIQQRTGADWKWQSYDVQHDPGESKDLFAQDPSRWNRPPGSAMRSLLNSYSHEAETAFSKRSDHVLSDEEKEMLRSLGYVSP